MKSLVFLRGFDMFVPRPSNLCYKDIGNKFTDEFKIVL